MHILFVCHEYPPVVSGGIGTAVATLARGLVRAGHKVTVIGYYKDASSDEWDQGVRIFRLKYADYRRAWKWLRLRMALQKEILLIHRRWPIDVIEWPDFDGWRIRKTAKIVEVLKVHGGRISHRIHGFGYRSRLYEALELRMMRSLPHWIGVSHWFNEEWRVYSGANPLNEEVVYNPVDTDMFRPGHEQEEAQVFYSGGLRKRKGVLTIARSARIFLATRTDVRLRLACFEADVSKEQFLREVGGLRDRIDFLPFMGQAQLAEVMARAALFLMPSYYESCGNGWIEAMSCGIPVVGSNLSCGPEVIAQDCGFTVSPDDPEQVAEAVLGLLASKDLRMRMGLAGRRRAESLFSVERGVRKSEQFYERCVQRRTST